MWDTHFGSPLLMEHHHGQLVPTVYVDSPGFQDTISRRIGSDYDAFEQFVAWNTTVMFRFHSASLSSEMYVVFTVMGNRRNDELYKPLMRLNQIYVCLPSQLHLGTASSNNSNWSHVLDACAMLVNMWSANHIHSECFVASPSLLPWIVTTSRAMDGTWDSITVLDLAHINESDMRTLVKSTTALYLNCGVVAATHAAILLNAVGSANSKVTTFGLHSPHTSIGSTNTLLEAILTLPTTSKISSIQAFDFPIPTSDVDRIIENPAIRSLQVDSLTNFEDLLKLIRCDHIQKFSFSGRTFEGAQEFHDGATKMIADALKSNKELCDLHIPFIRAQHDGELWASAIDPLIRNNRIRRDEKLSWIEKASATDDGPAFVQLCCVEAMARHSKLLNSINFKYCMLQHAMAPYSRSGWWKK